MQLTLMVMSQVPEQLKPERFMEYISGLHLYPPHTPVQFEFTSQLLEQVEINGSQWGHLTFNAQVSPEPFLKADAYLVVIDNHNGWLASNGAALEVVLAAHTGASGNRLCLPRC
jgi:hypothetical protein